MKELTIHHSPAKESTPARVRVSYQAQEGAQPQEKEVEFAFQISDEERKLIQWYLEEYLGFPWGEFRNRAERAEELMKGKGVELFDAVFNDRQALAYYSNVVNDLDDTRIVIHADSPEGISIPWELMRDSTKEPFGVLAHLAHAFIRSQPNVRFTPRPLTGGDTFNILMVICRPGGPEGDVPFQSVARPLLELFRPHRDRINLDILRPPTFEQLTHVLQDNPGFYHVLHFDGHGTFPQGGRSSHFYQQQGEQGRLLFEGEDGKPNQITGEKIGQLVASTGVPVVLLNACQSGMTKPDATYASVGNHLLQAGTGGVVAMAYSVYVQTAVRFMARLYEGLINGEELSRAVALGRAELRSHPQRSSPIGEVDLQDWMVPILFEATSIRLTPKIAKGGLRLDPNAIQEKQAAAGVEIGCPDLPDFGFIGRDGVMLDLERAFQKETVVLLQGMAGVGKTEAAMGFARWRAETGGLDGPIFFFKFEQYLPLSQVYDRVGQVFQPTIKAQLQVEWHLLDAKQRRSLALDILKQIPCLLIWDNFEPVAGFPKGTPSQWTAEEQKELRDFLRDLRGGQTKVLLTSRRDEPWLGKIYRRVEVGGLKLVEAQELAVRVLQRAGLDDRQIKTLPAYNDLLRYLRGNPLAIQVVLPELKRMQPDALLKALQAGEAPLPKEDSDLGREHSLAASLTYRLDALDTSLRQRLGLLWLFQGFVDADILAAMCRAEEIPDLLEGLGRDEWIGILDTVAEVGLLRQAGEGYYTVHPALPWFFHDLAQQAFPGLQDRLEQIFSAVYSGYGSFLNNLFQSNARMAIDLLQAEEGNLIYALHLARQYGQWDAIAGILYGLNRLLDTQGRWVEWERLVTELEAETADANGEPLPGREYLWLALLGHRQEIAQYQRDFETQERIVHRLKEHYERAGDDRNHAVALHQLGRIAEERRQFEEAERWYRQSLAIKEHIGNEHGQASTLHQLGRIAEEQGNMVEAVAFYKQAEAIFIRVNDPYSLEIVRKSLQRVPRQ
ncbi:MAG TPA: CHAT domain-containing protein [Chthonomonadaceae bacterium]|nr:CHAT domain-containing protein [Chthonomonadaceae bacterium]